MILYSLQSFGEGDVIGCFLDLTQRTVRWAKNGHPFDDAYRLPDNFAAALATNGSPVVGRVAFFPTVALNNSTVELNFGDSQFSYFPGVRFFHALSFNSLAEFLD